MITRSVHNLINFIDNRVPKRVKRFLKERNPQLIDDFYRRLAMYTSDRVVQVRIQDGPLRGRALFCSLKHQRSCYLGNFEPLKADILQRYLEPGSVIFDVGGHIGYFALLSALCVRPSGRVIAFEPSPTNAAQFRQNMDVNGDLSAVVTLNELAVADTPGVARFTRGKNSYVGHLADTASGETFDVQVTTLDRFASASNLWPDFVKVDAEGAEPKIFAGMQDVLRRKRPTLLTELHDEAGYGAFRALLREHRYVSRRIESHESLSDHPVWQPEAEYLALPSERHI